MALPDKKLVKDAMVSCLGGVDSGREPVLIDTNQLAWGINVQCRGGSPASRPRFTRKTLTFATTEIESWYKGHPFQGRENYYSLQGNTLIIVSIGGRLFAIDVAMNYSVYEVTPTGVTATTVNFNAPAVGSDVAITVSDASKIWAGYPIYVNGALYTVVSVSGNVVTATNVTDTPAALVTQPAGVVYLDANVPTAPLVWMEQAEQFLVIQNGKDGAIIFDGAKSRRAVAADREVPTGTAMAYNEEIGRLCVGTLNNEIAIGDVVGSSTDAVIKFTETQYLSEGGKFRVPLRYGSITGMEMLVNLNRANGQGVMVVSAKRGFCAFNLPPNRDLWKTVTYPLQVNMPLKFSATSQDSIVQVNGDLYYRAKDGLRTFIYAVREYNGVGNISISSELVRSLSKDDDTMLQFASGILFDNRLVFTSGPAPSANGTYHRAVASLDFAPISRSGAKSPPVYDGIWTGLKFTSLIAGDYGDQERAFIFALDANYNQNELWELHKEIGNDNENRVTSVIELRSFICAQPLNLKKADSLELWVDRAVGQVDFTVQYRPDSYPCWFDWGTDQICVQALDCSEDECKPLQMFNAGYRTRIGFGQPPDAPESLDNKPARNGYEHQMRLSWTGQCRIRKVLFKAQVIEEEASTVR